MRKANVDANYLLRFLVADDPAQGKTAGDLFAAALSGKAQLVMSPVALFEAYWVLTSRYGVAEPEARAKIGSFLDARVVEVPDGGAFLAALAIARKTGHGDLIDCYHVAFARLHGAELATFDKALAKLDAKAKG